MSDNLDNIDKKIKIKRKRRKPKKKELDDNTIQKSDNKVLENKNNLNKDDIKEDSKIKKEDSKIETPITPQRKEINTALKQGVVGGRKRFSPNQRFDNTDNKFKPKTYDNNTTGKVFKNNKFSGEKKFPDKNFKGKPTNGRTANNKPDLKNNAKGTFTKGPFKPATSSEKTKNTRKRNLDKNKKVFIKKREDDDKENLEYYREKKSSKKLENPVPKEISINENITVSDLAKKMNLKTSELIKRLMKFGLLANLNQIIDSETAQILADEYDCKVNITSVYDEIQVVSIEDNEEDLLARPPIVTVMGHVDHGKTKLLDSIRSSDIVAGESGGITQHIGAYKVSTHRGDITFIDTPGHEAFTRMRLRGAQITDIVILIVSAIDGVMPQTIEAISHAKEANIPIIVAVNKMDLPDANPETIKTQLSHYNLLPEEWQGETIYCYISAKQKTGIEELLDSIILQAEVLELKANPNRLAEGRILESKTEEGRGIVCSIIIQKGTLKVGDVFIAGAAFGKVRAMFDDRGNKLNKCLPSQPIEIIGFDEAPQAGDPFQIMQNEKKAREISTKRKNLRKIEKARGFKKITLDTLYSSIKDRKIKELKIIVKGDVMGSIEAIESSLLKLSFEEVRVNVIHKGIGAITENDVTLASVSNAIIIGFNVRPNRQATVLAEEEKVDIRRYSIIYDVIEEATKSLEGLLSPELKESIIGNGEVIKVFKTSKYGNIAGVRIDSGKVNKNSKINIFRDDVVIHNGKIKSMQRIKDYVSEANVGQECGFILEDFDDFKEKDIFEFIEIKEIAKKLK